MAKFISLICFLAVILPGKDNQVIESIKKIQDEIRLLNLINGLELNNDQIVFIIEQAQKAQEVREEFEKELNGHYRICFDVLGRLRENRIKDNEIDETLRNEVAKVVERLQECKQTMFEKLNDISENVKKYLDSHQLYKIEKYVPCLIPPPGEAKIGQNEEAVGLGKMLEKIRGIPDKIYEKRKSEIAERAVKRMKEHLPRGYIIDEEKEKREVLSILDKVRSLSDVDFELQKAELASKLKNKGVPPKLPIDVCAKIEEFLLNPLIIPLLKEKLRM